MTLAGDLKESFVEVSHPSSPPVDERSISSAHQLAGPANHILISRTFAALKGPMQFTVDPNILLPRSLLPQHSSQLQNLELFVGLAKIEADVTVLSFAPAPPQREAEEDLDMRRWRIRSGYPGEEHKKVLIKTETGTGNMTLRINTPEGTPIVMETWSTFGHVRLFLPRSTTGRRRCPLVRRRHGCVEGKGRVRHPRARGVDVWHRLGWVCRVGGGGAARDAVGGARNDVQGPLGVVPPLGAVRDFAERCWVGALSADCEPRLSSL